MATAIVNVVGTHGVRSSTGTVSTTCELLTSSGDRRPIGVATFSANSSASGAPDCKIIDSEWTEIVSGPTESAELTTFTVQDLCLEELFASSIVISFHECGFDHEDDEAPIGETVVAMKELRIGTWLQRTVAVSIEDAQGASVELNIKMDGPLRLECRQVCRVAELSFTAVDAVLDRAAEALQPYAPVLQDKRLRWAAIVATVGTCVSCSPFVLMFFVVALPVALPLVLVVCALFASLLAAVAAIAASYRPGRLMLQARFEPLLTKAVRLPAIQQVMYQTCSRRDLPRYLIQSLVPRTASSKLVAALALDAIGNSSYVVPFLGEAADLVWGPMQALIVSALFAGQVGDFATYFSAAEEVLPFTDIIPSSTLIWMSVYGKEMTTAMKALKNGAEQRDNRDD